MRLMSSEVEGDDQMSIDCLFYVCFLSFFFMTKSLLCFDGKCLREHAEIAEMGFLS